MGFDDIPGNARIKAILRLALRRGRAPHALLFVGPPGVGKRRTAIALAQALNCFDREDDACGVCDSCRAIAEGRHPDVIEIVLEKKRSSDELRTELSIDQFRDVKQLAYLRPLTGRRRVFLWNADLMSADAGHSILKVLEEPPATTMFLLISESPDLVLPTVRSRCQMLTFGPISAEEIERALRNRGVEEERARTIALLVRGNLDRALDLDWAEAENKRTEAWEAFCGLILGGRISAFLKRFALRGRKEVGEDLAEILELFSAFGRDIVLLQEGSPAGPLFNPDYEKGLRDLAARLGPDGALRLVAAADQALAGLDRYLNPGLVASALAARMTG
jgi:DNA polymerase-3 subunit delta'